MENTEKTGLTIKKCGFFMGFDGNILGIEWESSSVDCWRWRWKIAGSKFCSL